MRTGAPVEHRLPTPERLLPEWFFVALHILITTPDVVDKDIQSPMIPADTIEQIRYLFLLRMITLYRYTFSTALVVIAR